jgi:hypothetical protein
MAFKATIDRSSTKDSHSASYVELCQYGRLVTIGVRYSVQKLTHFCVSFDRHELVELTTS